MKTHFFLLQLLCLSFYLSAHAQVMDLSGTWRFAVDRNNEGISAQWYLQTLNDQVQLPGSMITNGKGDPVSLTTPWVGSFNDQTFFKQDRYARYRTPDNFKIPYWLQPDNYYAGVAWYQRDIEIPKSWKKKSIHLFFERCHWESRIWIDGKEVGMQNALSAPQQYDLTNYLTPGKHTLSVRVDNAVRDIDPGENSHSISDHTQGNWNGIAGSMYLEAKGNSYYKQLHVFPQAEKGHLTIKANICNTTSKRQKIDLIFRLKDTETTRSYTIQPGDNKLEINLPMPKDIKVWDEFNPNLYTLTCTLQKGKNNWTTVKSLLAVVHGAFKTVN